MKRYSHAVSPVLLVFAVVAAIGSIAAQKKESGSDPYTQTKREWLVTEFNSQYATPPTGARAGHLIHAIEDATDENTVILWAGLIKGGDREIMNESLDLARDALELIAEVHGFDDWLIIREQIRTPDKK